MTRVDSDVFEKQLGVAWHFLDIDRPERALETLESLPGGGLDEPQVWVLRSAALHDSKRYEEAADVARRGLELDPASTALLALLCLAEGQLGDLAAAERAILAALELDPEDSMLLCNYAHVLVRGLWFWKAARVLDVAARSEPDDPEVARARMALAYVSGNDRALERTSEALLALEPEDTSAHRNLAVFRSRHGDVKRAERHYVEAARSDPTDHEAAAAAREARVDAHWLFWPLRPIWRFGVLKTYAAHWVVLLVLGGLAEGADETLGSGAATVFYVLLGCFAVLWLLLVVYSWVGPPLIRPWLRRRAR